MARMRIHHLSLLGDGGLTAEVEFSGGFNLIHGPSDTGKSFMVSAIDFMLGASKLQEPVELKSYHSALLGISIDGVNYTLVRKVQGGATSLYEGLFRVEPGEAPGRTLSAKHSPNDSSLSGWLLQECGLAGRRLRKNVRNDTVSLSFRDLAHLAIINESKIQDVTPPVYNGIVTNRTRETSVLKLLLDNVDDSELVAVPDPTNLRRLKMARLDVIDELISRAEDGVREFPTAHELEEQRDRLVAAIGRDQSADRRLLAARERLLESASRNRRRAAALEQRRVEVTALRARFSLLQDQYLLDLERLDAIAEGGSLLGYFSTENCPLCGAEPSHQHRSDVDMDPERLTEVVALEEARVRNLLAELAQTFDDLRSQEERALRGAAEIERRTVAERSALTAVEAARAEGRGGIQQLTAARVNVERQLSAHRQLAELLEMRQRIDAEAAAEAVARGNAVSRDAIAGLSSSIAARLRAWGYAADDVRYDREVHDVFAGGQFRADHGQGVRAVLHAAFTVALADYCLAEGLPHPGFVVLDSPLVMYREPDPNESAEFEPGASIAARMYTDLSENFLGQVILMENTDPPVELAASVGDVRFSASDAGRYGFFPLGS
jgi:hypothetical protein